MFRILAVAVGPKEKNLVIDTVAKGDAAGVRRYIAGLIEGLAKRGHKLGTDFVIDYRERLLRDLKGAVAEGVKQAERAKQAPLIYPMSTSALKAAMSVSTSIPIVFPSISKPEHDGVVPGGNATGVSAMRSQTTDNCLELFKQTVPSLKEVFALHKPNYEPATRSLAKLKFIGKLEGVAFKSVPVKSHQDIAAALGKISQKGSAGKPQRGVMVMPDDMAFSAAEMIGELALKRGLPTFFSMTDCVTNSLPSALAGFGVPQRTCGELAAEHVHEIWRGAKPGSVPITRGGRFRWVVSRKVAKALKIDIPPGAEAI